MNLDIHITTCHRKDVKCRPRKHENEKWNVKEWTHEERLEISKISVESIINFANKIKNYNHSVEITLLNDGSDIPEAVKWIESLKNIKVKNFPARGSSAGINDHFSDLNKNPPDYILHIEDDNLLFNGLNIDWLTEIDKIKKAQNEIKVFTFRSGLPVEKQDKGYYGAWGPIKGLQINNAHVILFKMMGNAHHIMHWNDYKKFFPLHGNTGGCEAYMNSILETYGFNCEPQFHVHCFHSHMLEHSINNNKLNSWHKTGEGFEYGIKNMNDWLKNKNTVISKIYKEFPNQYEEIEMSKYDY